MSSHPVSFLDSVPVMPGSHNVAVGSSRYLRRIPLAELGSGYPNDVDIALCPRAVVVGACMASRLGAGLRIGIGHLHPYSQVSR